MPDPTIRKISVSAPALLVVVLFMYWVVWIIMKWFSLEDKFRLYLSWSLLVAKPMCPVFMWYCWTKKENRVTQTRLVWSCCCEFLKKPSLAPGPALPPGLITSLSSMVSSTCSYLACCWPATLLSKAICSSLDHSGRGPDQLGLVPLTLWVEELTLVAWNIRALLNTHCERLMLSEFSPRSNLQMFSPQLFLRGCFPGV